MDYCNITFKPYRAKFIRKRYDVALTNRLKLLLKNLDTQNISETSQKVNASDDIVGTQSEALQKSLPLVSKCNPFKVLGQAINLNLSTQENTISETTLEGWHNYLIDNINQPRVRSSNIAIEFVGNMSIFCIKLDPNISNSIMVLIRTKIPLPGAKWAMFKALGQAKNLSLSTQENSIRDTALEVWPNNLIDNINQPRMRSTNRAIEFVGIMDMFCIKLDLPTSKVPNPIMVLTQTKIPLPCAKWAKFKPAPQFKHSIEIDINFIKNLFSHPRYLNYMIADADNNRPKPTPAIELNDQMDSEDSTNTADNGPIIIDRVSNTNVVRGRGFWYKVKRQFFRFVIIHILFFCLAAYLYTILFRIENL